MAAPDLIFIMGGSNSFSLNGVDAPEGDFTWSTANTTDEEWISDGNIIPQCCNCLRHYA